MTETIRLSKYIAAQFSCSRREAENYIEGGWVRVDGQLVEEPGYRIELHQIVELAENARAEDRKPATILLHKPAGYGAAAGVRPAIDLITPQNQAPDDRSGRRFVKVDLRGVNLLMPLAADASGLIVFTQDHGIERKLVQDASRIEQEYVVEVAGGIAADGLKLLNHGLSWRGAPLPPAKVSWQNETHLRFALKNPPEGLIKDICRQVGLTVKSMKRLRIGRLPMAGLAPGQWRYLLGYERF
ncbi:RNA-binding protein [Candidimonas sp. SYP-B2681]|uniref:rRNA pseudouridine synthase n=1 Tax=Candidimonas sp. SYP-B2681 TaxID=2497686 RepID=UPI000F870728|nr:rRNA pseudouridine synthase [Candidimonas sp. SYP-B2681]RTZ42580.1 RNA-binding protein [Candidimonas sp. SYP-B2681]